MAWKIAWAPLSVGDLEGIRRYWQPIEPDAGEIVLTAIVEHVSRLAFTPYLGAVYRTLRGQEIRETQARDYRIFYRLRDAQTVVEILRVWHAAQQEPEKLI